MMMNEMIYLYQFIVDSFMFIKQIKAYTPQHKLKLLTRILIAVAILIEILVFCSLAITASNLMITN